MKYTSQPCCDKTMDDKNGLASRMFLPNFIKSWWIQLLSKVLGGSYRPLWISPWGKFYGYTHRKAAKSSPMDQVEWLHLRTCAVPSWCGASRTIWDCCWQWGNSTPRAAAPATSPEENRAWKWMRKLLKIFKNFDMTAAPRVVEMAVTAINVKNWIYPR